MDYEIQRIDELPPQDVLIRRARGLALLDAILMQEWEGRYFSFNARWTDSGDEMMASMRTGSGEEYFIHFSSQGAVGKVLDQRGAHGGPLLDDVPDRFRAFKTEAAFNHASATYYFWQEAGDTAWYAAPPAASYYGLLAFLARDIDYYRQWAEEYYERTVDTAAVLRVVTTLQPDADDLLALNPDLDPDQFQLDYNEIMGSA